MARMRDYEEAVGGNLFEDKIRVTGIGDDSKSEEEAELEGSRPAYEVCSLEIGRQSVEELFAPWVGGTSVTSKAECEPCLLLTPTAH
jgi:hypothetical protein